MLHQIIEKQSTETTFIVSIVPDFLPCPYKIINFFKVFLQKFAIKMLE